MTATVYPALTNAWSATNRYTAAAVTDVLISDPLIGSAGQIAWTTTLSDTAPLITPEQASKLPPDRSQPITMNSGERLWLAIVGAPGGVATLEI